MKNNYYICNMQSYRYDCFYRDYDPIQDIRDELRYARDSYIAVTSEMVDYKEYFSSSNIEYRLNIGEEFEGSIIKKVEGTEEGDIIYYTDKILNIDENSDEKELLEAELKINIEKLEKQLREAQRTLYIKKKWYHFWK